MEKRQRKKAGLDSWEKQFRQLKTVTIDSKKFTPFPDIGYLNNNIKRHHFLSIFVDSKKNEKEKRGKLDKKIKHKRHELYKWNIWNVIGWHTNTFIELLITIHDKNGSRNLCNYYYKNKNMPNCLKWMSKMNQHRETGNWPLGDQLYTVPPGNDS